MKLNLRLNNLLNKDYSLAYDGKPGSSYVSWGSTYSGYAYQTPGTSFFVNLRYEPQ
jgi:outer membrane receptor protein involved in Fe transport